MEDQVSSRRRIQIGLLVSHLDEDFDSSVCEGAMIAAKEKDANLIIFPGRYIDGVYADKLRTEYEYQNNVIFDIPCYNKFDVLLVLVGTIGSHLDKEHRAEFLKRFKGTPVITITSQIDGYPCISVDNRTGMEEAIQHLITVHNCRKIGFVSGPETSDDANERLDVYKDVLSKNHIEYVEDRVVYGNFSKYVADKVETLLDRCPDLDAICFANDQMAVAGYEAFEKRGIRPGRDIFVTGFDDDPVASELVPHLTTVKADPTELGYKSVFEAVNFVTNGDIESDMVPSTMVLRNSCGCNGNPRFSTISLKKADDIKEFARTVSNYLFSSFQSSEVIEKLSTEFIGFIEELNDYSQAGNVENAELSDRILSRIDNITAGNFFNYVTLDKLYTVFEYVYKTFAKRFEKQEEYLALSQTFSRIYRVIAERNSEYCHENLDDNYFMSWQTNSITRDMLIYDFYDDQSYFSVVDKLQRLHMTASYLYAYEPPITNLKDDHWKMPEKMCLKAYHNKAEAVQLSAQEQIIGSNELFTNPYIPKDRQYSLVVMPLFSNEIHYGLLMCEIEHQYFHYIQSASFQLCAALKILDLMKQQYITQRKLSESLVELRENNQLLSELSKKDALTGCFNRRGFYEEVRKKLRDGVETSSQAYMVFADLDSLKTINDRFGHEDGDFAIRSAAEILNRSFSDNVVVSRIGGDEFVVCAFVDSDVTIKQIREKVEKVCQEYNDEFTTDKPYLVHISVGVYPFKCTEIVDIGELLSHADALLYEQKKHKKPILKELLQ